MPQMNPVVLKDYASAAHTFVPAGQPGGVATFIESTGVPIGNRKLTISRSSTTTGREKAVLKLALPIVQDVVVNGISRPTVVRTGYADITFTFDGTSNTNERKDALGYVWDLLGSALAADIVGDLEDLY